MDAPLLLSLKQIVKSYEVGKRTIEILHGISLDIAEGEFIAIMGHSGSGKSTLLNILGLLDVPTSGTYLLDGLNVERLSEDECARIRNEKIGFIFQSFHLLARTSALDNVCLPMMYKGVPEKVQKERALMLLTQVGLGHRVQNRPNELSGGEQQRVAIARALANEPRILLADEPTGNLDSVATGEILRIFTQLHAEGHTIIMITHEEDVARIAKRVVKVGDGRILSDVRT